MMQSAAKDSGDPEVDAEGHSSERSVANPVLELSAVATMIVERSGDGTCPILDANALARELGNLAQRGPIGDTDFLSLIRRADDRQAISSMLGREADSRPSPVIATFGPPSSDDGGTAEISVSVHIRPLGDGTAVAQLVPADDGWQAVEDVRDEQQRFRSALMELSAFSYSSENDDIFYQKLLERAVDVVPGAQGGSIQLNIAGTTVFRFVAAVGYDLGGLQEQELDRTTDFFRDAFDPRAHIVRSFDNDARNPEIVEWLERVGRLSEIVVNVSAPVVADGLTIAFLSLDNFECPEAMNETSVEMTTVLSRLIGELWRRRQLEDEVRKEREAFRHQALHDQLTGLANRRNLERSLAANLSMAQKRGVGSAVLFVDVDDFKGVNDRLGHEAGDMLLVRLAEGLATVAEPGDAVGRWGGDEFLILPTELGGEREAMAYAERILDYFDRDASIGDGLVYRLRVTVGVGWSEDSDVGANELVRAADRALYAAKAAGKGLARLEALPAGSGV